MPITVQKPLRIGLTGGIGAGKSYISSLFAQLGIAVYDSDMRAKALMHTHTDLRLQIIDYFGASAYREDGSLNRAYIADLVFKDSSKLMALNSMVHPVLKNDAQRWFDQQHGIYAIQEAAILYESHMEKYLDAVILIYAPETLRIQRVMHRDHISMQEVKDRISKQISDEDKLQRADYVIYNDDTSDVAIQIEAVDAAIRQSLIKDSKNRQML